MKLFLEKANKQLDENLPFVLYKKPNESNVVGVFQENDGLFEVKDYTEKGFVFASFDANTIVLIPESESTTVQVFFDKEVFDSLQNQLSLQNKSAQNDFENLVTKAIKAIENQEFKKVVLSRKESVDLVDFNLFASFKNMVNLYPSAFVSCFFHPKIGLWLGATPEQLLKSDKETFTTIALAGTQKDNGSDTIIWQKKEQEEQQFVTDYILEKLKVLSHNVLISNPYSVKAGNIWHIKTDISGVLNLNSTLQKIIEVLHPTPAVCGFPKEASKAFILKNEQHDRGFYAGFLGELNKDNQTDLFVNLRCMEIKNSKVHLYMGCGITKDSNPEKEWEESVNKSLTIKKILAL